MIVAIMTTAMATTTSPSSLPRAIELPLQRRRSSGVVLQQPGDAAHLGAACRSR